ncbi:hypothetical protein, partial [Bradyrhizobium sp. TM233]|uniref:hypothetical protein n=1 Tax=Bradyrhizobium sp. TM233 TaxID=2599801 RepID=UPI0030C764D6
LGNDFKFKIKALRKANVILLQMKKKKKVFVYKKKVCLNRNHTIIMSNHLRSSIYLMLRMLNFT